MAELTETAAKPTRAYVIHPDLGRARTQRREPEHALAEAVSLALALPGIEMVGSEVANLREPNAGKLFGKGKLAEIAGALRRLDRTEKLLIDGPVTPVQQRNLEKDWGVKLLDRTGLILEIFADRACTRGRPAGRAGGAVLSAQRGWFVPGPTWSVSAAGWASWAVPARRRSRPTVAPSTTR